MGQYKIWASKNVGILEDYPTINTGENEVAELWYGEYGLSRFLLKFDFSDYLAEYTAGRVPHFSASTFTDAALNIKNCSPIFEDYDLSLSTQRATSAEIILNKVDTAWDEGIGHDYISTDKEAGFACWSSAQTLTQWSTAGGDYSTEIMRVVLDNGSENFSGSVSGTDMLWSTVTGTNNGYMLKFTDAFEALSGAYKTITKFYTRHTNTVHQPHITITWDNQITDERDDVYPGVSKRLYLYTKKDGTFENVNDISGVTISGVNHSGFVASDINNPLPGIYYKIGRAHV